MANEPRWPATRSAVVLLSPAAMGIDGRLILSSRQDLKERIRPKSPVAEHGDLRRAEKLLAAEVALLEMVARGKPLLHILDALSRHVEDLSPGCCCSVLLVAPDRTHFRVGAGPTLPDAYNRILDGKTIDGGYGPCSLAALMDAPVITTGLESDPRWAGSAWPPLMRRYGFDSCWSMPIHTVNGEVSGIFAIYRADPVSPQPEEQELIDRFSKIAAITINRNSADEALLRREDQLSRALAQLAEGERLNATGSFTADLHRNDHRWSDEFYRVLDIDPTRRPSMRAILERVHPDDIEMFGRAVRNVAATGQGDFTFRMLTQTLDRKHLRCVTKLLGRAGDQPIFMGTVQDITASKEADAALDQARSELARVARAAVVNLLTASIAHEVSQPLSGIRTNADTCLRMLSADPPDLDGAAETARRTIRDAGRASEVMTRLRDMFAKKPRALERFDLNGALRDLVPVLASELQRNQVTLTWDLSPAPLAVMGDRIQLQQVALNLLLNGIDAMSGIEDRPRTLLLRTEADPAGGIRLLVRDAGIGVDPASVTRLFDPFYTTKTNGMGIGLSISRSIIEAHQGRLSAMPNEGVGATFIVQLPAAPLH